MTRISHRPRLPLTPAPARRLASLAAVLCALAGAWSGASASDAAAQARRGQHPAARTRPVKRSAALGVASSVGLGDIRLVDYFPASQGWGAMWWNFDPAQMDDDFARIAALHANAVRIVVSASAFGFPALKPVMQQRLAQTIALAYAHGLRVELTLFNEWRSYGAIEASRQWAQALLAPLRGDQRIAYVDLHNELPADTSPAALAWARAMVPFVQEVDGGIPVTVSTSISSGNAPLEALVHALAAHPPNLYDVHYYGNAADAYAILGQARRIAGGVPLYLGETGFATSPSYGWARGLPPDPTSLEAFQDYYFRMVEHASAALGLPAAAPWILYDMPGQGGTAWGQHMGILHADGTPKPAATSLSSLFAGGEIETTFNNGFEQSSTTQHLPTVWRRWLRADASWAVDHTVAHSGTSSARISGARGSHLTGCPAYYVAPITTVTAGTTYTATAWARGADAAGLSRVVLVWSDLAGRYVGSTPSRPLPQGNSGWTQLSVSAQPPGGAQSVEIDLQVCEDPGTTWFDDVSFTPSG